MNNKKVKILDSTLREGEQQARVRFSAQDKIIILKLLEEFVVDIIEVGHPGISQEDENICKQVVEHASKSEILMHARANIEEVRAVKRTGAHWVGIWASVNSLSLENKFNGHDFLFVANKIIDAIKEAKCLGLKVRFTIEDASRTSFEEIDQTIGVALNAGADCISLADTVGILEPKSCKELISYVRKKYDCILEMHLHNDLGLALSNALTAIDNGIDIIDSSVLGIGERAGITDLVQLSLVFHRLRDDKRFNLKKIPELTQAVSIATGYRPDDLRPIIGKNCFTHSSAYHVKAVKKDPKTYEPFPPEIINRKRTIMESRPPLSLPKLPVELKVGKPFKRSATELRYHRNGPGQRWVLLDSRVDNRSSFYVIQRIFDDNIETIDKHVDTHAHHCDSAFIFWGENPDGTGLTCNVQLGDQEYIVESPATIFIPAFVEHSYYYLNGRGTFTNIVLSPEYNNSLTDLASFIGSDVFKEGVNL